MNQQVIALKFCPIVYEDDHYLFVNKPAGLASRPGRRSGGASVLDLLSARADVASLVPLYEVNTWQSGVLGYAKSQEPADHLLAGLETGSAKCIYVAVVRGRLKQRPQTVTAAIKQVQHDHFTVDLKSPAKDLPATKIEPADQGATCALVRCRPSTLNHHQVRAHLQSVNLHIVGDTTYAQRRGQGERAFPPNRPGQEVGKQAVRGSGPVMLHLAELRFHHPVLKRAITVRAKPPPEFAGALDDERSANVLDGLYAARLRAALAARLGCFLDEDTSAFRVLNGRADGVPGLVIELYDDTLIIQVHQGKFDAGKLPLHAIARWYLGQLGATAVYVKQFAKDRSRTPTSTKAPKKVSGTSSAAHAAGRSSKGSLSALSALRDPQPLAGKGAPEVFTVRENGLSFLVKAYDGYAVGLFLDHRENRRRVRELSAGQNVLNLFCYTCGFSVAAAAGGAKTTVNVDIARKCLEWGKENFKANHLALDDHVFINDDAFNYFRRAKRQQRTFDLIVIDPPSFARPKKGRGVFELEKDLQRLVAGAISLLVPGGVILVSTNHRGVNRKWLREQITLAAGLRKVSIVSAPRLPLDFAGDPDHAKTVIARIS